MKYADYMPKGAPLNGSKPKKGTLGYALQNNLSFSLRRSKSRKNRKRSGAW